MNAFCKDATAAGMGNAEILLHHRAGAADLVADHGAELRQQQVVHRALDPVALRLVPRREFGVQRVQRGAAAAGGGDDPGGRENIVHRPSLVVIARSEATKQSNFLLRVGLDCFAALAMTVSRRAGRIPHQRDSAK